MTDEDGVSINRYKLNYDVFGAGKLVFLSEMAIENLKLLLTQGVYGAPAPGQIPVNPMGVDVDGHELFLRPRSRSQWDPMEIEALQALGLTARGGSGMKDLAFGRPFALKRLSEQSIPIPSESGTTIQPGEHYLEDGDGKLYRLDEISIADFYGDFQVSETAILHSWRGRRPTSNRSSVVRERVGPTGRITRGLGPISRSYRGLQNTQATAGEGVRRIILTLTRRPFRRRAC